MNWRIELVRLVKAEGKDTQRDDSRHNRVCLMSRRPYYAGPMQALTLHPAFILRTVIKQWLETESAQTPRSSRELLSKILVCILATKALCIASRFIDR